MRRAAAFLFAVMCAAGCEDAAHDQEVAALGGEATGVPPGALHRPGQPCLTCHGGSGPASAEFSIGGTVYLLSRQDQPANGAVVQIEDINGVVGTVPSNDAGNFYITTSEWEPAFPIQMKVTLGNVQKQMSTSAYRSGSCADCHLELAGQNSPGHIYMATNSSDLTGGGANP